MINLMQHAMNVAGFVPGTFGAKDIRASYTVTKVEWHERAQFFAIAARERMQLPRAYKQANNPPKERVNRESKTWPSPFARL